MKKLLLTSIAALLLATGTARAMDIDVSDTWCARHEPSNSREEYYAWNAKCHSRRGTKPRWMSADRYIGPPTKRAGRPFYDAAKRHFGRGFYSVRVYMRLPEYCHGEKECIAELETNALLEITDARYLGLDEVNPLCDEHCYLLCSYRTKPIRFFNCKAWEGE